MSDNSQSSTAGAKPGRRLSVEDLELLNRQIIVAARTGAPLAPALRSLSRDLRGGRLRQAVDVLEADIKSGRSLSEAVERQGAAFPPLYAAMLRAAEASGDLRGVVEMLSHLVTSVSGLKRRITMAAAYPLMVLVVALGIFGFLAAVVVPRFRETFSGFGAISASFGRPQEATLMFALSAAAALLGVVLAAGMIFLLATALVPAATGRVGLRVPVLGNILRAQRAFVFCRTLSVLLRSGVPLREAIGLVREVMPDAHARLGLDRVAEDLHGGSTLGEAVKSAAFGAAFPPALGWLVSVAESRGDLPQGLYEASEFYREEAERRGQFLTQVLPPVLIISVGALVVLIMFPIFGAMMMLFQLITHMNSF